MGRALLEVDWQEEEFNGRDGKPVAVLFLGAGPLRSAGMQANAIPARMDLKKDKGLTIVWADGVTSTFDLATLRSMCPCATCKEGRAEKQTKKPLLKVLPGNYTEDLKIAGAELVGNYAIKLSWTDGHDTGIYSFAFLRELGEGMAK